MKKLFLILAIICFASTFSSAQNKKAEKEAAAQAQFDKAVAAIDAKDFVIVVDTYESSDGTIGTNTDEANFLSYEREFVFLQGMIVASNSYTNKTTVDEFSKVVDKKGNIKIEMQVMGSAITAKIEIFMKKGGNYADVIVIPTKGNTRRFSGEVIPRAEAKYYKRPNVV
ncbi:MAG: hypothetical protein A2X18_11235 [Bacteroidetes bacterium GWF2_40_14]|nr:MAG: hypothetical protein A2X18_11235 [Bacteroidetes bacterium GWF2_40_14]